MSEALDVGSSLTDDIAAALHAAECGCSPATSSIACTPEEIRERWKDNASIAAAVVAARAEALAQEWQRREQNRRERWREHREDQFALGVALGYMVCADSLRRLVSSPKETDQ